MENTWEYDRVIINFTIGEELKQELNKYGADGWEIISYEETKPKKFGDKFECIVVLKKEKSCNQEKT